MQKANPNCVKERNVLVRYVNQKKILPVLKGETQARRLSFPYVGSTKAKLRYKINNYKSIHSKLRKKYVEKVLAFAIKKIELKQEFSQVRNFQKVNLRVALLYQVEDLDSPREKELYRMNRFKSWALKDLNVREVYEAYNLAKK